MKLEIRPGVYLLLASVVVILGLVGINYGKIDRLNKDITGQTNISTSTLNCPAIKCDPNQYWSGQYTSPDDSLGFVDVHYCKEYSTDYKNFSSWDCQGFTKCESYKSPQSCNISVDEGLNPLRDTRNSCITECYKPYDKVLKDCDRFSTESDDLWCGDAERYSSCSCISSCLKKFSNGCAN